MAVERYAVPFGSGSETDVCALVAGRVECVAVEGLRVRRPVVKSVLYRHIVESVCFCGVLGWIFEFDVLAENHEAGDEEGEKK